MKIKKIHVAEIEQENGETFIAEKTGNEDETAEIIRRNNFFEPFTVSITVLVKETGKINTANNIANILQQTEVSFGKNQMGLPTIWAKFAGKKEWIWLAIMTDDNERKTWYTEWYKEWITRKSVGDVYPDGEGALFRHLTRPAERLVDRWVMAICDHCKSLLDADKATFTVKVEKV